MKYLFNFRVLLKIEFFKNCVPTVLIPLAATITVEKFKFGDYLIKKFKSYQN